jgi:aminopeptidase
MKITQDILKQYARLIVRSGANVQQGQTVLLFVAVDQAAFAEMIAE